MFEEEQRLGKGNTLSDSKTLDKLLLGSSSLPQSKVVRRNNQTGKRPVSAYNAKTIYSDSDRSVSTMISHLRFIDQALYQDINILNS